jgi:hypothetical protein
MLVYVLHQDGTPLMPCKPVIARLLLKSGKARVVRRTPFTIKLTYDTTKNTQELTLGIDSGSKTIGSAVRDDQNRVYYLSEVTVRQDVKDHMEQRRMYRRNRRNRKTRYRKPRFLNRKNSIQDNRYSPTLISKYSSLIKELWFIYKILPITNLIIEMGTFDPHAMHRPEVMWHPWLYQKGLQFGFNNIKAYVLSRDQYTCQYCKNKNKDPHLEIHHIVYKSQGGSDRPDNLLTLCKTCHEKLHKNQIKLTNSKLRSTFKHATQMNVLQSMIRKYIPDYTETYGYITKTIRQYFSLEKAHCIDAVCVEATSDIQPEFLTDRVIFKKCISKGNYQLTKGKHSEKKMPKAKIQGFKRWDTVLYNNTVCFIKGRMSTGYAVLCDILGNKYSFKPIPKFNKMKRISARKSWIMIEGIM